MGNCLTQTQQHYNAKMKKQDTKSAIYWQYGVSMLLFNLTQISQTDILSQFAYEYNVGVWLTTYWEAAKWLSFVLILLFLAPFVEQIGYRKLLLPIQALILGILILIPLVKHWILPTLLMLLTGFQMGISKIGAYSTLAEKSDSEDDYAGRMNFLEMFGAMAYLIGAWLIWYFVRLDREWRELYWIIAIFYGISLALTRFYPNPLPLIRISIFKQPFWEISQLRRMLSYTMVSVFMLCLFLAVFLNFQSQNWSLHFVKQILQTDRNMPIQILTFSVGSMVLGRCFFSFLTPFFPTRYLLIVWLWILVALTIWVAEASTPLRATDFSFDLTKMNPTFFFVPLLSFLWSPVVPTLYALGLFHIPKHYKASAVALVSMALIITEWLAQNLSNKMFEWFSFTVAYLFSILLIAFLIVFLSLFVKDLRQKTEEQQEI